MSPTPRARHTDNRQNRPSCRLGPPFSQGAIGPALRHSTPHPQNGPTEPPTPRARPPPQGPSRRQDTPDRGPRYGPGPSSGHFQGMSHRPLKQWENRPGPGNGEKSGVKEFGELLGLVFIVRSEEEFKHGGPDPAL